MGDGGADQTVGTPLFLPNFQPARAVRLWRPALDSVALSPHGTQNRVQVLVPNFAPEPHFDPRYKYIHYGLTENDFGNDFGACWVPTARPTPALFDILLSATSKARGTEAGAVRCRPPVTHFQAAVFRKAVAGSGRLWKEYPAPRAEENSPPLKWWVSLPARFPPSPSFVPDGTWGGPRLPPTHEWVGYFLPPSGLSAGKELILTVLQPSETTQSRGI